MSQVNLFYNGVGGEGFGWAVCNRELIKELSKLCNVHTPATFDDHKFSGDLLLKEHVVFTPLLDHDFNAPTLQVTKLGQRYNAGHVRGRRNFAYCFFESELGPNAATNAAKYDIVFCGSTWCLERMKERGITNGRVLIQGVDHEVFFPQKATRTDNEFRIFSGGKFEYRKGQDIVIAAFRELSKKYDNMRLVCAWHNPWPQLLQSMHSSPHIVIPTNLPGSDQSEWFKDVFRMNGVEGKITVLGQLSQPDLAAVMNQTDLGVFPNRCEGGTNLVLMEYLACGNPIVATAGTGHADILNKYNNYSVSDIIDPVTKWDEMPPRTLAILVGLAMLEGAPTPNNIADFTWERAARTILDTVIEYQ